MSGALASLEFWSGGLWPYLVVILFGFLPSEIWRWTAVFLVRGLSEEAEILVWVRAVATALLAGVVAKLLLTPSGALAVVPVWGRWGALGAGILAFFVFRKSMMAGVIIGEVVLIGTAMIFAG